jgi:hypothetical protein
MTEITYAVGDATDPTGLAAIPAAPPHPYATHIPDRRPIFRTHKGVGQAKNAIIGKLRGGRARHGMTIYRLEGGEYQPWVQIEPGQNREEIPELAPKPQPRSHVLLEIRSLAEREQYYLKQAEQAAARRRELEAAQ